MLYAFGLANDENVYKHANSSVDDSYRWILMDVAALKKRLESNVAMELGHDYAGDVIDAVSVVEDLAVASPDVDFLESNLPKEFWRKPKVILNRTPQVPSQNIAQVQVIAKKLRDIRRSGNFPDLKDTDAMVRSVENITETIKGIERMITVKQNLFTDFYKASATLANFYVRGHDLLLTEAMKYDNDDAMKAVNDRAAKVWESICSKMGI